MRFVKIKATQKIDRTWPGCRLQLNPGDETLLPEDRARYLVARKAAELVTTPEAPDTPDAPEASDTPEISDAPDTPDVAEPAPQD